MSKRGPRTTRTYRFVCNICGRAETRMAKTKPHVCLECRKITYKRTNEKFNKLAAEQRAELRRKRIEIETEAASNVASEFITEMRDISWATRFEL